MNVTLAIFDQNGRVLGPRALDTRRRVLDATEKLLGSRKLRDLRVINIAREIGASAATFYQYFRDVDDVVLCLAEQTSDEMPGMLELIGGSWRGEAGIEKARAIGEAFIEHWDAHHAVLRVRNLASDEGFAEVKGELAAFIPAAPVDLPEVSLIELQEHHMPPFRSKEYFFSDERREWMRRFE